MNEEIDRALSERVVGSLTLLSALAEHGSFAATARALGLDPSSISHRVRALEADLGVALFSRTTRRVTPTRAGSILCAAASRSLADIADAVDAVRDLGSARSIRLSVHSSLAMKWLLPRLSAAEAAGLDLSFDVKEGLATFDGGEVDAGFRFGAGPYPGDHATRLCGCVLQPVIGTSHPLAKLPDLDPLSNPRVALLGDAGAERHRTGTTWADYYDLLGRPQADRPIRRFDRADLMLQAAIAGAGVALGRTLLIEDDIARGLLRPVGEPVKVRAAYWLVTSPDRARTAGMADLTRWLKAELRQMPG
ncbi:LysR family transcriptional regulator [Rhodobacterales bacterium HKCCE2091]|nr:LysR family transcriptional regulator [Rhodobacterales bacterium HKCCE2091]